MPRSIAAVCRSGFFLCVGRGMGADLLFGHYLTLIVGSVGRVGLFAGFLSACKLCATLPMAYIDRHIGARYIVITGKIGYVMAAILYITAGVTLSRWILGLAMIINGVATALTLTTYQMIIRQLAPVKSDGTMYGRYVGAINIGYAVGGCIAYVLIDHVSVECLFIGIGVGSFIGMIRDTRLPLIHTSHEGRRDSWVIRKTGYHHMQDSFNAVKRIIKTSEGRWILLFQMRFSICDYILLIFVPILMIQSEYSLTDVALAFVIMRLPYVLSNLSGKISDRLIPAGHMVIGLYSIIGLCYIGLGLGQGLIVVWSIVGCMSLLLAMLRPIILGRLGDIHGIGASHMTGAQEFVSRSGEIIGALLMGVFASLWGIPTTMIIIGGVILFSICGYGLSKINKKSSVISYNLE